jgi:hypothetical protein
MAANSEDWWVAQERKEYKEDAFQWLRKRFGRVTERINEQNEWQATQTKEFVQNAAESLYVQLAHTRDSLVIWLGIIAVVALASAGLWFGVGGVAMILAWIWWRNLRAARALWRFDRFRNDCFRKLLEIAEHGHMGEKMIEEDKEVVLKCRDSILYPLAVAPDRREEVNTYDLERIDTLHREYCHFPHVHTVSTELKCDLCAAVHRVRDHVEGVLSKFEGQIEAARIDLIARIDGGTSQAAVHAKNFLEKYRDWVKWRLPQESEVESSEKLVLFPLLATLRDQDNWTFEAADRVRELCRAERSEDLFSETGESGKMFDLLTAEMESAAKQSGVEQMWQFYNTNKNWLFEGSGGPFDCRLEHDLKYIRRAFGRHNPEATVRELIYSDGSCRPEFRHMQPLKSYGFDLKMVNAELAAARKLVRKVEKERKEERLMFETAQAWLWQAEEASKRVAKWD